MADEEEFVTWIEGRAAALEQFVNEDVVNLAATFGTLAEVAAKSRDVDLDPRLVAWLGTRGGEQLNRHMATSLWSAIEVFLEDLWIETALRVDVGAIPRLARVKASVVEVDRMRKRDRYRVLWEQVQNDGERKRGVDRFGWIFVLIGVNVTTKSLVARGQSVTGRHGDVTDDWLRATLHELRGVRNVILHRGGVSDGHLEGTSGGRYKRGQQISIQAASILDYGDAVHWYAGAAVSAVGDKLDLPLRYE